jgi:tetratricopeptide (TPR) repeat protein
VCFDQGMRELALLLLTVGASSVASEGASHRNQAASAAPVTVAQGATALPPEVAEKWNAAVRLLKSAAEQSKAGQKEAAFKTLQAAEVAVGKIPGGAEKLWLGLARGYHQVDAVTLAEAAVKKAGNSPEAESTRAKLMRSRRIYGLTASAAIPPEQEPEYISAFEKLSASIAQKKLARAELDAAEQSYPKAPGLKMLDCEARVRANKRKEAEPLCESALAQAPELARAHYLLGLANIDTNKRDQAIKHLRQAIDLDPEDDSAWKALADSYRKSKNTKELAELEADHQKKLAKPLP